MKEMKTVGDRINHIRKTLSLTMEEFGNKIDGSSRSLVHAWINNKYKPNKERLEKIARLGGVTVNWLLYGVDDFMPPIPVYSPIQVAFNELDEPLFHVPYSSIKELADLSPNGEYFFIMGQIVIDKLQEFLNKITFFSSFIDLKNLGSPKSKAYCMYTLNQRFKIDGTFNPSDIELDNFLDALGITTRTRSQKVTPMTNLSLFKRILDKEIIIHSRNVPSFPMGVAYKGFYSKKVSSLLFYSENRNQKEYYHHQLSSISDEFTDFSLQGLFTNDAIFFIPLHLEINSRNLFNAEILTSFYKTFLREDMKLYDIFKLVQYK